MALKDAVAKLMIQLRTAVLWDRANRTYSRAIRHIERGLALKKKGDMYSARATAIEEECRSVC